MIFLKNYECKFEIRIMKTEYENWLLSHLREFPYLKTILIFKIQKMIPILIIINIKYFFYRCESIFSNVGKKKELPNTSTHCIYDFGQPCLVLLTSNMEATYNNYNTIRINETIT